MVRMPTARLFCLLCAAAGVEQAAGFVFDDSVPLVQARQRTAAQPAGPGPKKSAVQTAVPGHSGPHSAAAHSKTAPHHGKATRAIHTGRPYAAVHSKTAPRRGKATAHSPGPAAHSKTAAQREAQLWSAAQAAVAQDSKEAAPPQLWSAGQAIIQDNSANAAQLKTTAPQVETIAAQLKSVAAAAEQAASAQEEATPISKPASVASLAKEEAKAKFGDEMTLIVRDALGREMSIKFRSSSRMQVLMKAVCKRLGVEASETHFIHKNSKILPSDTPDTFGLVDQDIIEVVSPSLHMAKQAQEAAQRRAAEKAKQRAKAEEDKKSPKVPSKVQAPQRAVQTSLQTGHQHKQTGKVNLRFVHEHGKEIRISTKKDNLLGGTMDLVCKRMGVNRAFMRFLVGTADGGYGRQVSARDTVQSLGLHDDEIILVKRF